jgi:hypothetical protein
MFVCLFACRVMTHSPVNDAATSWGMSSSPLLLSKPETVAKVSTLRPIAEQWGSCSAGATADELHALVESLCLPSSGGNEHVDREGSVQVAQPAIPPAVAALWREGAEWHFSHGHCDVFGCNIFPPTKVVKITHDVFGDWECRNEWQAEIHPETPSVAEPGWLCFCSYSEFDYLFCCFDRNSPHFGQSSSS